MAPVFRHGKGSFFSIVGATGSTINLSSGLDSCSLDRSVDTADVTTFGKNDKVYIVGLRDAKISLAGNFSSTHVTFLDALLGATAATAGNWIYGPESTANTRRKLSGSSIVTKLAYSSPVGGKVTFSMDLQNSGTVTSTTF